MGIFTGCHSTLQLHDLQMWSPPIRINNFLLVFLPFSVATILCFAPLVFLHVPEETSLEGLFRHNDDVEVSFAATITACVPMIFDILLDVFSRSQSSIYFLERCFTLAGLIFPSVLYFIVKYSTSPSFRMVEIYNSTVSVQSLWVGGALLSILTDSASEVFGYTELFGIYSLFTARTILQPFICYGSSGCVCIQSFLWIFSVCGCLWYASLFGRYVIALFQKRINLHDGEYLHFIDAVFVLAYAIFVVVYTSGATDDDGSVSKQRDQLITLNALDVLLSVLGVIIPLRLAKTEIGETERLLENKQSFVRYISHELRTPMNVASVGMAVMEHNLTKDGDMDPETQDVFLQIKDSIVVATEILNDLLMYESLNSNLMVLEKTVEKPVPFIRSILNMFVLQARNAGVTFVVPTASNVDRAILLQRIHVDTFKMSQVLRNFASNALKFTPRGGSITVSLECKSEPIPSSPLKHGLEFFHRAKSYASKDSSILPGADYLYIRFIDTGVGISAENIRKVFQEMVQFNANELQGGKGTGLGLFISKGIVELHGGSVNVFSEGIGKGCTFTIKLPLFPSDQQPSSPPIAECHPSPLSDSLVSPSNAPSPSNNALSTSTSSRRSFLPTIHLLGLSTPRSTTSQGRNRSEETTVRDMILTSANLSGINSSNNSNKNMASISRRIADARRKARSRDGELEDDEEEALQYAEEGRARGGARLGVTSSCESQRRSSCSSNGDVALLHDSDLPPRRRSESAISAVLALSGAFSSDRGIVRDSHTPAESYKQSSKGNSRREDGIATPLLPYNFQGKHVLVVDDSDASLKLLALLFRKFGAYCETGVNGAEAIAKVRENMEMNGLLGRSPGEFMDESLVATPQGEEQQQQPGAGPASGRRISYGSLFNALSSKSNGTTPRQIAPAAPTSATNRQGANPQTGFSYDSIETKLLNLSSTKTTRAFVGDVAVSQMSPPNTVRQTPQPPKTYTVEKVSSNKSEDKSSAATPTSSAAPAVAPFAAEEKNSQLIDLIILDHCMPVMTGAEACRVIRAMGFKNPIFGLTGIAEPAELSKLARAGTNYIFRKPLDMEEFRTVLESLNGGIY